MLWAANPKKGAGGHLALPFLLLQKETLATVAMRSPQLLDVMTGAAVSCSGGGSKVPATADTNRHTHICTHASADVTSSVV